LAKKGFNIYLVSRTEEKLKKLADKIKSESGVDVKYRAKDFAKSYEDGFFDDIFEDTSNLDVSIVINNVGMAKRRDPNADNTKIFRDILACNTVGQTLLTDKFLQRMDKREQKSAIINLSSFQGGKPLVLNPLYSATKGYNDFYSRANYHEFKDKIDISKSSSSNV